MKNIMRNIFIGLILISLAFIMAINNHHVKALEGEDDITVEITACNLSFENSVKIVYAVSLTGSTNYQYLKMLAYESIEDYYEGTNPHVLTYLGNDTVNNKLCAIFIDNDVAAKQMTTDFYAYVTYAVPDQEAEVVYASDLIKYSILQYVKNIYGTEQSNDEFDATLRAMLEYGACTQKLFDYKEDRLANDIYYQIKLENGYLEDGTSQGLYTKDEEITFSCLDGNFFYWEKANDSSLYSYDSEISLKLTSDLSLRAVIAIDGSEGLIYTKIADKDEYELSGLGECDDTDIVVANTFNKLPVTKIADGVFKDCTFIENVYLQSNLHDIGEEAFSGCTSLNQVILSKNTLSIGTKTFNGCSSLTNIVLPNIVDFNVDAFTGCTSLKNIYYLGGVDSLVGLINPTQLDFMNQYNILFYSDTFTGLMFMDKHAYWHYVNKLPVVWSIEVPNLVINIDEETNTATVTYGTSIQTEDVYIPSYYRGVPVTEVKMDCFAENTHIKNVYFGKNITKVNKFAFKNCSNLRNVYFNDSLTYIDSESFYGCQSLQYVELPSSLTTLPGGLFFDCRSLKSLEIPEGVTSIGTRCFSQNDALEYIVLPSTLTFIDEYALNANSNKDCKVLYNGSYEDFKKITVLNNNSDLNAYQLYFYSEEVNYENGNYWHYVDGEPVIWKDNLLDYTSELLEADGNLIYYICSGVAEDMNPSEIIIPSRHYSYPVLAVKDWAFRENQTLTKVIIHEGVKELGGSSFYGCTNLSQIILPSSLEYIGKGTFADCNKLTNIVIGENVTYIGLNAFVYCPNITIFFMGSSEQFASCIQDEDQSIRDIPVYYYADSYDDVDEVNKYWHYIDGEPQIINPITSLTYTLINNDAEYEVTSFKDDDAVEVEIPKMYNGKAVTSIGDEVFKNKTNLKHIIIPNSIKYIGDRAFYNCSNIKELSLPETMISIGEEAFEGMTNLKNIFMLGKESAYQDTIIGSNNNTFNNKVRYFQEDYVDLCVDSNYWYYLDGVPTVWESTKGLYFTLNEAKDGYILSGFGACCLEKVVIIPSTYNNLPVTAISQYALANNICVEIIYMPDSITTMEESNIYCCDELKQVYLSNNLTVINKSCVYLNSNLEYVLVPAGIKRIDVDCFSGCEHLTKLYYMGTPDSFAEISGAGKEEVSKLTIYYYSENEPTTVGNYFHISGGRFIIWPSL